MRTTLLYRLLVPHRSPVPGASRSLPSGKSSPHRPVPVTTSHNKLLTGKTVLLTGAAGLVGSGIAHALADQGANIYCCDIDGRRQEQLVADLSQYDVRVESFLIDISQRSQVDQLGDVLDGINPRVDALIHSAGIKTPRAPFLQQHAAAWNSTFETNVTGALHLTQRVCKGMMKRAVGGSIVFITSIHQSTVWGEVGYGASKAALAAAIKELALDLAPHGIRVNGIAPGAVGQDAQGRPVHHPPTPLGHHMVTPAGIGRVAVFLTSEYFSQSITGTVISVDGGLSLHSYLSAQQTP